MRASPMSDRSRVASDATEPIADAARDGHDWPDTQPCLYRSEAFAEDLDGLCSGLLHAALAVPANAGASALWSSLRRSLGAPRAPRPA